MHRIPENEVVVVKDVKRHDRLPMSSYLHATIEFAMKLVEGKCFALHDALTVNKHG